MYHYGLTDVNEEYLHLPSIFLIKCVGGPSVFMISSVIASLCKSAQRHLYRSAQRGAYEVVDVND